MNLFGYIKLALWLKLLALRYTEERQTEKQREGERERERKIERDRERERETERETEREREIGDACKTSLLYMHEGQNHNGSQLRFEYALKTYTLKNKSEQYTTFSDVSGEPKSGIHSIEK
ncbi:hypothetical protein V1264_006284 [Littorina saxatilis]|uniref:Uncharacterized protein n=1 Tax=Littorina saxatilis TaxID=31220 RepID=A0AAN9AWU0_9CAEN